MMKKFPKTMSSKMTSPIDSRKVPAVPALVKKQLPGRWNHLYRLWEQAMSLESLPQFDRWIAEEFKRHTKFGSKDRKWYSEVLFAGVRFGAFALFCELMLQLKKNEGALSPDALFLRAKKQFIETYSDGPQLVKAWKTIPSERFFQWISLRYGAESDAISGDEFTHETKSDVQNIFDDVKSLCLSNEAALFSKLIWTGVPPWFESFLQSRQQQDHWKTEKVTEFLRKQNFRPPLWLRLNHDEKKADVISELSREAFEVQDFGAALKAIGAKGIFATASYRDGFFEIQDLASQKIGAAVLTKPGQLVWDCCAGGGGKTIQIAAALRNKGAVYASDIREYKLDEVRKRARRAGFHNVRCMPWDGENFPAFPIEVTNRSGFDWVLVDAPCTSSGTWRRNPDAKYRVEQSSLQNLTTLQSSLLAKASKMVRPGGHLVYSTCSWLVEENEAVIQNFIAQSKGSFELRQANLYGNPEDDADTMFAAILVRT
jgi:16S rRNA (cytosine967-C5)-methyltransferase